MKHIEEKWNEYEEVVVPAHAGAVQRLESRRAFYAGAQSMLSLFVRISKDNVPETQGVAMLESCDKELTEFWNSVMADKK